MTDLSPVPRRYGLTDFRSTLEADCWIRPRHAMVCRRCRCRIGPRGRFLDDIDFRHADRIDEAY